MNISTKEDYTSLLILNTLLNTKSTALSIESNMCQK